MNFIVSMILKTFGSDPVCGAEELKTEGVTEHKMSDGRI